MIISITYLDLLFSNVNLDLDNSKNLNGLNSLSVIINFQLT
jgi:hypothetical protein